MPRASFHAVHAVTLSILGLSALIGGPVQSQTDDQSGATESRWPVEAAELRLQQAVAEGFVPGAGILLVNPQSTQLERFFGRYHADTRLPVSGASQWMAAATVLALVDAKALALDDPLIRFFPEIDDEKAAVSVRQLLAHTAGLTSSHPCLGDRSTSLAACAGAILQTPLLADPGAEIRYSEASYQVAGRIAEIVTGQAWKALFEERLKSPLNLRKTTYGKTGNPRIASGASTTLGDFGRFLRSLLEASGEGSSKDQPSEGTSLELMFVPQHGAAKMAYSPFPKDWRPALGPWIAEDDGSAWIQGLFGTVAWISGDRSEAGLLMTIAKPADAISLWSEMLPRNRSRGAAARRP